MSAVGEPNGTIVEDTIGENRIGGGYSQGIYYMNNSHSLFDALNHNCLIWPSNFQFQCTQGAPGFTNFTLADDGNLMHNGSEKWFACPAAGPGNDGSYNIFSDALQNTTSCESVTLRTGGFSCAAEGRPPSSPSASPTASPTKISAYPAQAVPTSSAGPSCPTDISSGVFQFPHLIVPTSPLAPDHKFGSSYKAYISPSNVTLFQFDMPQGAPYNETCALLFLFPFGSDLDPSAGQYYFSGIEEEEGEKGGLDFMMYEREIFNSTTYNSMPGEAIDYGKTVILPGNNYTIATFTCKPNQQVVYSISSVGNVELDYFQDSAPSPIGLYVVPCFTGVEV
jgi:Ubiquitin 3 binding protein But2 C-terminal domain/Cell wall mannoprotein PIR1-like, C-terminal domain